MRLPWPFGRRTPPDGPPSATSEDTRDGASRVEAAPDMEAPATGAWATLPPIQRTTSAPPLVAPAAPFLADVSGHRPLPPIVQPLGHETSRTAPPGLVVAHASPVPSLTSRTPMPTRPVQRRAADAAPTGELPGWSAEPAVGAATAVSTPSPVPTTAPVRSLATVSPATRVTPATRPLTRSPDPVAVTQRSTGRPGPHAATSSASTGRPASGVAAYAATPGDQPMPGARSTSPSRGTAAARTVSRWAESPSPSSGLQAGLGAPLTTAPGAPTSPGVREMPTRTSETVSAPAEPVASPPTRAGLGAPLPVAPASAVAQRLPLGAPMRRPVAPASSAPSPDTAPAAPSPSAAPAAAAREALAPTRSLPVLTVARRHADAAGIPTVPATHAADARHVAAPAGPASDAGAATRPTLGARPIRPVLRAQRDVSGAASMSPEAAVPARWASRDNLPATIRDVSAGPSAASDEQPVALERLRDASATAPVAQVPATPREIIFPARGATPGSTSSGGSAMSPGGPASGSGPSGFSAVQRQSHADLGPGLQRPSPAAAPGSGHPIAAAGIQARGPLALARPQGAAPGQVAAPVAASAPTVARIVAGPAWSATQPAVQTSAASAGGSSAGAFTATPVVQRVDGAAPAAPSEEGRSESELDELARALFGRFRSHLRAEVIHEREARGLSFDAF